MARAHIFKGTWIREIHETWENQCGWRTDVASSVLEDDSVEQALFVLDDGRGVFVPMKQIRLALETSPRRSNGMVGPFNVNPHNSTINGAKVDMEIKLRKQKAPEPSETTSVTV